MERPQIRLELAAADPEALEVFYKSMFGWDFQGTATGYRMVHAGSAGHVELGISPKPNGQSTYLTVYVHPEDLRDLLARAERLGGHVTVPPSPTPHGSQFAMIIDPEGHPVRLLALGPA